jgi:cation transport regulator ChaC
MNSAEDIPRLKLQPGEAALFGYGSLLWLPSFEGTYGRPYTRERHVAHLTGWRRVWDSLFPNRTFYFESAARDRCYPENIVYLNIRPATNSAVNGMLYTVTAEELAAFDKREAIYDRIDVTSQILGVQIIGGPAYVYVGKQDCVLRDTRPRERAAIRQTYLDIVERGLTELGSEFRGAYEASSDKPSPMNIIADRRDDPPT